MPSDDGVASSQSTAKPRAAAPSPYAHRHCPPSPSLKPRRPSLRGVSSAARLGRGGGSAPPASALHSCTHRRPPATPPHATPPLRACGLHLLLLQAATPEWRLSLPDSAPEEEEPPLRALFTDSSGDLPAPCPSAALALAEAARTEGDTTADEARSHCGGSMSDASAPSPRGSCPPRRRCLARRRRPTCRSPRSGAASPLARASTCSRRSSSRTRTTSERRRARWACWNPSSPPSESGFEFGRRWAHDGSLHRDARDGPSCLDAAQQVIVASWWVR